ncbi:MAG TPA: hypothetical protein VF384_09690 [Planctomycetota bacterium]
MATTPSAMSKRSLMLGGPISRRSSCSLATLASLSLLAACNRGAGAGPGEVENKAELLRVEYAQLADVYCLRNGVQVLYDPDGAETRTPPGRAKGRDVVVGSNIRDQRSTTSTLGDAEITYDFIGSDPDTLQPKLFIPREETSAEFRIAFEALDDQLREIAPMTFGQGRPGLPYGVVPRNAAVRLTFSAALGVDDGFFVERNETGAVSGLRNTEAVQLLKIVGDPNQPNAFVPLPVRVIVQGPTIVLDPVLLGTEGLQYQTSNNAAGMPASPDQLGANIRVAVALEGPLAIPHLRENPQRGLTGKNNSFRNAIVRDFRSGNASDTSDDFSRGFARDPLPLRIVGDIVMLLEKVEQINAFTQEVTVFKNGVSHEIDRGDSMRFLVGEQQSQVVSTAVVLDPEDDRRQPDVQHVRVRIRNVAGLESIDPSNQPGYPSSLPERETWLAANAPRLVLVAEFSAGGELLPGGGVSGDDPRNFLRFLPEPLDNLDGSRPAANEFVSPFAGTVVRFTKPVDMATVKTADTFFFAMRDLTSQAGKDEFIASRVNNLGTPGMHPEDFVEAKYRTPFLVTARIFDEDASQTSLRLQPLMGFYLDDTMRNPPAGADYRYFLHLISSSQDGGIRDLAGNAVDLQGVTAARSNSVVIPFTVDTRTSGSEPFFPDNLVVSIVRRFAADDEDANPSYFEPGEVRAPTQATHAAAAKLVDLFGSFVYLDNRLVARDTVRVKQVADNRNQSAFVGQSPIGQPPVPLAWCPQSVSGEPQSGSNTATLLAGGGLQNPLNPFGCRLQTLWREIDLSLSRTNPFDFNLDIEQMWWAPHREASVSFDEFDRVSLTLGHSEFRPTPCVGDFSSMPSMPLSGLGNVFEKNFAWNPKPTGSGIIETQAPRRAAYIDSTMTIDPSKAIRDSSGWNRYLPLPPFQKPYFVFRDETVLEQGLNAGTGSDLNPGGFPPYILSPFTNGQGRRTIDTGGNSTFVNSFWNDAPNNLMNGGGADAFTGGLVGSIALPLLADFWTWCDNSQLPLGGGYVALGTNGWQVALTVQSSAQPNFRVLSAGRPAVGASGSVCRSSSESQWGLASGGFFGSSTQATAPGDNTFYWIMLDVLKRQSVITNGFVDLHNPHRVPEGFGDPRLGPFFLQGGQSTLPATVLPRFDFEFDPPLTSLPPGTSLVPQFRAASAVDATPWYWNQWIATTNSALFPSSSDPLIPFTANHRAQLKPTPQNFALDPFKAGDAHIRKWDTRPIPGLGSARNWWTYFYNRTVTTYVENPNDLMVPAFTSQFQGPNEVFTPRSIRYVNWRFVTSNNTEANPPVTPAIESFSLSWRFQRP